MKTISAACCVLFNDEPDSLHIARESLRTDIYSHYLRCICAFVICGLMFIYQTNGVKLYILLNCESR